MFFFVEYVFELGVEQNKIIYVQEREKVRGQVSEEMMGSVFVGQRYLVGLVENRVGLLMVLGVIV